MPSPGVGALLEMPLLAASEEQSGRRRQGRGRTDRGTRAGGGRGGVVRVRGGRPEVDSVSR